MYVIRSNAGSRRIFVGRDDHTYRVEAWVAPVKGNAMAVGQRFVQWVGEMCHNKIILTVDQGLAIVDMQTGARAERAKAFKIVSRHCKSMTAMDDEFECLDVVLEHSPVGESQANGAVEDAVKRLQWQI